MTTLQGCILDALRLGPSTFFGLDLAPYRHQTRIVLDLAELVADGTVERAGVDGGNVVYRVAGVAG
jgi:hypothetical protein